MESPEDLGTKRSELRDVVLACLLGSGPQLSGRSWRRFFLVDSCGSTCLRHPAQTAKTAAAKTAAAGVDSPVARLQCAPMGGQQGQGAMH
jgi:hypothetical protein